MTGGGRFDFDDGGTYCGGWEDGKAHGHGICTGPKGQGEYSGAWAYGFEASGVYTWPSGNSFQGQWLQGKRHGIGVETKGRWVYRGEWTHGFKGRYGVRHSTSSGAKYEGTWTTGLQDGYGVETYADGDVAAAGGKDQVPLGSYQGQWLRGMRHGYGVRQSVPYGLASHYRPKTLRASLTSLRSEAEEDHVVKDRDRKVDESRGGFVLKAKSDESPTQRRRSLFDKHGRSSLRKSLLNGLKLRKQKSTGDIKESPRRPTGSVRSTVSNISNASADSSASGVTSASMYTDSNLSFVSQDDINDVNVTETYMGEWKNDKRSGFGISERSDGLKYEGEWYNNKKYGYGVTTFKDGTKEEGKYKNNILISSGKKSKLFLIRSSKMRERVDNAVSAAQRAAQIAHQKADIAITRMANARAKAEQADLAAEQSQKDSDLARIKAKEFAPEFHQPGTDILRKRMQEHGGHTDLSHLKPLPIDPDKSHHQRSRSLMGKRDSANSPASQEEPLGKGPTPMSALVSSAMDCAIASSSSQIVENLRKLEGTSLSSEPYPRGAGGRQERLNNRYDDNRHATDYHNDNNSRIGSPPREEYRGGPDMYERPQQQERQFARQYDRPDPRYSEMLNSTNAQDHFDQYRTRDDSGLGRDLDSSPDDLQPHPPPYPHPHSYNTMPNSRAPPSGGSRGGSGGGHIGIGISGAQTLDRSPDSGLSDAEDFRHVTRPLQRRQTLPSIMKGVAPAAAPVAKGPPSSNYSATKPRVSGGNHVHSAESVSPRDSDLYIIENGIRKRVCAEVYTQPVRPEADRPKDVLPDRLKLEKMSSRGGKGSLPDVSVCREMEKNVMPRDEVAKLSERRRAELVAMSNEETRRKEQEIVLRLSDLRDWCQQRQLVIMLIALNVSLATMFFNLLSQ